MVHDSYFDGTVFGFIGVQIGVFLITLFTIGFGIPWAVGHEVPVGYQPQRGRGKASSLHRIGRRPGVEVDQDLGSDDHHSRYLRLLGLQCTPALAPLPHRLRVRNEENPAPSGGGYGTGAALGALGWRAERAGRLSSLKKQGFTVDDT